METRPFPTANEVELIKAYKFTGELRNMKFDRIRAGHKGAIILDLITTKPQGSLQRGDELVICNNLFVFLGDHDLEPTETEKELGYRRWQVTFKFVKRLKQA